MFPLSLNILFPILHSKDFCNSTLSGALEAHLSVKVLYGGISSAVPVCGCIITVSVGTVQMYVHA